MLYRRINSCWPTLLKLAPFADILCRQNTCPFVAKIPVPLLQTPIPCRQRGDGCLLVRRASRHLPLPVLRGPVHGPGGRVSPRAAFRAVREGKAVPRPAHSATLVTALQFFRRATRGTTFIRPRSGKSCPKPVSPFSSETHVLRIPLSLTAEVATDYNPGLLSPFARVIVIGINDWVFS